MQTTKRALDAAEEGYRVRRELFRNGRATSVELTDSEVQLIRARLEAVDAGRISARRAPSLAPRASVATSPGGCSPSCEVARHSSSARSFASTRRSSSVEVSPLASLPAATSFSSRRMILPLRVFGSASVKRMPSGRANLPISFSTCAISLAFVASLASKPGLQRDEHDQRLALELVGPADRGRLGDRGVRDQRALDLGGADAVAGDVEHVVDAPDDPEVAVLVAARAVAGEVHAGHVAPVRLAEALVVAPDACAASRATAA